MRELWLGEFSPPLVKRKEVMGLIHSRFNSRVLKRVSFRRDAGSTLNVGKD